MTFHNRQSVCNVRLDGIICSVWLMSWKRLYERDNTRLYIVFVSQLKVIICFGVSVGSQFILEKENNDFKETES